MSDKFIIKALSPFAADMEGYMHLDLTHDPDLNRAWTVAPRDQATAMTAVEAWTITSILYRMSRFQYFRFNIEEETPNG